MYHFYEDAGHGWLKVTKKELEKLNILNKITSYSYMRGKYIYLEEDCDLSTFIKAKYPNISENNNSLLNNIKKHISNRSKIRTYQPFKFYTEKELTFIQQVQNKMLLLFRDKRNINYIKNNANLDNCVYWNNNYRLDIDNQQNN